MQEALKYLIFFLVLMIFFIARENIRFNKSEGQTRGHIQARDSLVDLHYTERDLQEENTKRLNNLNNEDTIVIPKAKAEER